MNLLKEFWLNELGASEEDLLYRGTVFRIHGTLEGYGGIYFFQHGEVCIVSFPKTYAPQFSPSDIQFSSEIISQKLAGDLTKLIGPAWIGELNQLQNLHGNETRQIERNSIPFRRFLEIATPLEVENRHMSSDGCLGRK